MKFLILLLSVALASGEPVPSHFIGRITGGSAARLAAYPFAASVLYGLPSASKTYKCGGVIVTQTSILTAASCIDNDDSSRWQVRVGTVTPASGGTLLDIERVHRHDGYKDDDLSVANVGLLHTVRNIVFGTNIQPATLAKSDYPLETPTQLWAIGWGAATSNGVNNARLQHVSVNTFSVKLCKAFYTITNETEVVCVGFPYAGNAGQCHGDEGNALVQVTADRKIVVGIFSWIDSCGSTPSVNTLVGPYYEWIIKNSHGLSDGMFE